MRKITLRMWLLVLSVMLQTVAVNATVRYVKAGSSGDGSSWQSATGNLQAAIDASASGDEVWVAAGTYKPDSLIKASKKNSRTFFLKDGVSLFGGFYGTEKTKEDREVLAGGKPYEFVNETILSADDDEADVWTRALQDGSTYRYAWKDDNGLIPGTSGNGNHVLYASSIITNGVEINGFTLKGGNANVYQVKAAGGALYASGNVTLRACRVVENSAWFKAESTSDSNTYGGAVYLNGTEGSKIVDCYFARNYSHSSYGNGVGGAVYAKKVEVTNCTFDNCVGLDAGGGIYNDGGTVSGCTFTNCYGGSGGAIYNSGVALSNSVYSCRGLQGGGIFNNGTVSYTKIANCYADAEEFGTEMGGQGGGLYNLSGNVIGSVVYNNKSFRGGGVFVRDGKIINCTVQHNALREASDTANIGYLIKEEGEAMVFNTIGNPDADAKNFVNPTSYIGNATTKDDSLSITEASLALSSGSEFIDKGTKTEGVDEAVDILGNPRVSGTAIDKGAYEYRNANITITFDKPNVAVKLGIGGNTGDKFSIDWGDGKLVEYEKAAYYTETLKSDKVKVYGDALLVLMAVGQNVNAVDISGSPTLYRIQIGGNNLKTLDVSHNAALTGIYCESNKIEAMNVAPCKALKVLDCHSNKIKGTIDCSAMQSLSKVDCSDNEVTSLLLPHHATVYDVDCSNNNISKLDVSGLSGLDELSCHNNKIESLDLKDLTAMTSLYINDNKLSSIDVTKCANLKTLTASANNLTSVDLSANESLEGVYLYDNKIESLDLSKNPNVRYLNVNNNKLTALNTSAQSDLSLLIANNNQIESVDLKNNKRLSQIQLGSNNLTTIDVSMIPYLSWLKVNSNNLQRLDIDKNAYLYWLECNDNKLTELNVSNNTYLEFIKAQYNVIKTLDISKNTGLKGLLLNSNAMDAEALNAIIENLGNVADFEINDNNRDWARQLNISYMDGTADAKVADAEAKGWIVTAEHQVVNVNNATAGKELVRINYYDLSGRSLSTPTKGVNIVVKQYSDGTTATEKITLK